MTQMMKFIPYEFFKLPYRYYTVEEIAAVDVKRNLSEEKQNLVCFGVNEIYAKFLTYSICE
jgi:hypothetical protein